MTAKIFLLFLRGFRGNVELAGAGFMFRSFLEMRLEIHLGSLRTHIVYRNASPGSKIKNHQDRINLCTPAKLLNI